MAKRKGFFGRILDFFNPKAKHKPKEFGFKGFEGVEGVRPVEIPTLGTYNKIPNIDMERFEELNQTQLGREIIFSDPSLPLEMRQQALIDWLAENPHPHRSDLGEGRNNNNSWRAFREIYSQVFGE